ncbi:PIN domain-containing protein [Thermoflexus hugenholtzii]
MYFLFDTCVLIDYLRDPNSIAGHAIFRATDIGRCCISIVSIIELYKPNKDREKAEEEVRKIYQVCERLNIRIVYITPNSRKKAVEIVRNYYSNLGKSCIPDALIISSAIMRRAYVVTKDYGSWSRVYHRVLTPEEVVRRF